MSLSLKYLNFFRFGLSSRTLANAVKSICETFENVYLLEEVMFFYTEIIIFFLKHFI